MTTVDERMIEALRRALKFEDDGVAYYQKALEGSSDPLAIDILKTLRDEEIKHKKRIRSIHDRVTAGKTWVNEPTGNPMPSFSNVFEKLGHEIPEGSTKSELAALTHALDIEASGRSMYQELARKAPSAPEREFYERLGNEEGEHLDILGDSIEYFEDPQGWFRRNEKGGLDGA